MANGEPDEKKKRTTYITCEIQILDQVYIEVKFYEIQKIKHKNN